MVIMIAEQDLLRSKSFQLTERVREARVNIDRKEYQEAPTDVYEDGYGAIFGGTDPRPPCLSRQRHFSREIRAIP
jgi:hypothetical protein